MSPSLKDEMKLMARHSSVYGLANVLNRAVSLLMLPVYTRYLTPADYGVLEIMYFLFTLISIVLQMGLSEAMSRFFFDSEDREHRHRVVSTAILGFGSLSILVGLALVFFSGFSSEKLLDSVEYGHLFVILFLTLAVEFSVQVSYAYFRVVKQSFRLMTFSLSQLILTVLLNVFFLVYLEMGVKGILLGTLLANSLLGSIMIGLILKNVGVGFSPDLYLKMIRYGLPLIPSSIATYLMIASDRYFVKEFVSLRHTGLYSLGYKLGSVSHNFVTSPFIQIWFPRRFELFNQENSEEMFARIFTYFTAVLTFGALGISLLARDVLQIMTTEAFWPAANVVPLIALAHVIHAFFYHFTIGISYKKKTIYYVYINITAGVVNLILNYFLIRRFGMWGAAYATILTYTCRTGLVYYFSSRLYPIVFEKVRILKILLAAAAVYVLGRYLEQSSLGLDILVKLFVLGGFPLLLLGAKFFREDELTAVKGYARRLKARFFGNRTPDRDATDGDNRK